MIEPEFKPIKLLCSDCGGHSVYRDAFVKWSVEKQDWVFEDSVLDNTGCFECGDTSLIELYLNDEPVSEWDAEQLEELRSRQTNEDEEDGDDNENDDE